MTLLETYLANRPMLKRLLVARLGNADEAEDLTQELYVRLTRGTAPENVDRPVGYLCRMALNLARDHRRERHRTLVRDGHWADSVRTTLGNEAVTETPAADTAYAAKERVARLIAALDELSPHCRRVFVMHKFDGLAHSAIATKLKIARSTVEKHMTTALKHLVMRLRDPEEPQ